MRDEIDTIEFNENPVEATADDVVRIEAIAAQFAAEGRQQKHWKLNPKTGSRKWTAERRQRHKDNPPRARRATLPVGPVLSPAAVKLAIKRKDVARKLAKAI